MQEILKILIGIGILILGIPVGNILKLKTKDEQKAGQRWFRLLTATGLFGGFLGLLFGKDWVLFTFFFVAIVTSRSLQKGKSK